MPAASPNSGQCGLYVAKKVAAGEHLLDYRGVITLEEHECRESDYTLLFVEEGTPRLTLDAAKCGNEARFINDFRNTGRKANCRFAERFDSRGVRHMGVYALVALAKGEELLLSYGKGYWTARATAQPATGGSGGEVEECAMPEAVGRGGR